MSPELIEKIGMAAGIALPFFNIPLIIKVYREKDSSQYSLTWTLGVWGCIILMTPQGLLSSDPAFRAYSVVNIFFFSIAASFILKYRMNRGEK